jgi:serine/threonine-protein kinase
MSGVASRLMSALEDRYTVERELGEGGMATVYLAEDLKHDRKVAIKVLKPELAAVIGAERFLAEIKTTANLQHPHILPLFDSGEADGFLYYVMPYVDGETLRDRLDRERQLPVDEAVELARDVASALQYAHERDVVHRDIKPANILLHAGQPIVADFGIALAISAAGGGRMTETGLSLGTPHYMSPEQATADRDLDARSDVYSLGCVLYEMIAGQPPHTGPSAQSVLVRILTEDPRDLSDLRRSAPRYLAAAVSKAIEKLPADRFDNAQAMVDALGDETFRYQRVGHTAPQAAVAAAGGSGQPRRGTRGSVPWALVAVGAAMAAWGWLKPGEPPQVTRTEVNLPGAELTGSAPFRRFDISPDGHSIVYVAEGNHALHIRGLSQLASVELPGTDSAFMPAFSPAGDAVLFRGQSGALRTVSLEGAPPLTIVDGNTMPGADWGEDGYVYFARQGSLYRVPATGGSVDSVLSFPGSDGAILPSALPGGRGVLYTRFEGDPSTSVIEVLDLESGETKALVQGVSGQYASTGHLVFVSVYGALLAAPFDLGTLEVGPATPLLDGVSTRVWGTPEYAISKGGHLVYHAGDRLELGDEVITSIDRGGNTTLLAPERLVGDFEAVDVSPDGRYLAVMMQASNSGGDLWVYDQVQETFSRLTSTPGRADLPTWSPDGRFLYYVVITGDSTNVLFRVPADASGSPEAVLTADFALEDVDMSAEGRFAVFKVEGEAGANDDVWYADLQGDGVPKPFLSTAADEEGIGISPDGRWLAYESDESGRDEVYIRAFPDGGARIPISLDGGTDPLWAHSGRELFFMDRSRDMLIAAQLEIDETVTVTSREELFPVTGYEWGSGEIQHAVTPDDQSFLFIGDRTLRTEDRGELVLVLNFFEELKERVPNR